MLIATLDIFERIDVMKYRLSKSSLWVLSAAAAALSLTACAGGEDTPRIEPPEAGASNPAADADAEVEQQQGSGDDVADNTDGEDAAEHGLAVLEAFLADTDDYDQWWSGLSPLLSPGGADMYDSVDPINVPEASPTGETEVVTSDELESIVSVETDVGDFEVTVVRASTDADWAGEHIRPPEEPPATGGGE